MYIFIYIFVFNVTNEWKLGKDLFHNAGKRTRVVLQILLFISYLKFYEFYADML